MTDSLYGFEFRDVDHRRSDRSGTHDIKQLWSRSHEILNLDSRGMSQVDIAKHLGITPATVSNTLNSTLGREKKSEIRKTKDERYEEINKEVLTLTEKALKVYNEIFGEEGDEESSQASLNLKFKAANVITLDIAGMRAPTKIATSSISEITRTETVEFIRRGQAAAKESGFLVEVPGESEPINITPEEVSNAKETEA